MTTGIEITWNVKQQHIVQWTEFLVVCFNHESGLYPLAAHAHGVYVAYHVMYCNYILFKRIH